MQLAGALIPYLISPIYQPSGFRISGIPVAASFASLSSFEPIAAGPLGAQYLVRASKNGGIGSLSINDTDGQWCGYWHEQGGLIQTLPKGKPPINDNGEPPEMSTGLRAYLGHLAGPPPIPTTGMQGGQGGDGLGSQGLLDLSGNGMQPINIKLGKKKKEEPLMVEMMPKSVNVLQGMGEEEKEPEQDTVLISRSEPTNFLTQLPYCNYY